MTDFIMALAGAGFVYSLIPQLMLVTREKEVHIAWQTLAFTVAGLWVMCGCLFSLGQPISGLMNGLTAGCWSYILVAKIIYQKH